MSKLGHIYRRAALRVEQEKEEFSCSAVDWAAQQIGDVISYYSSARYTYCEVMSPRKDRDRYLWTTDFHPDPQTNETLPAARDHRVVALCLMAAMADAGDL